MSQRVAIVVHFIFAAINCFPDFGDSPAKIWEVLPNLVPRWSRAISLVSDYLEIAIEAFKRNPPSKNGERTALTIQPVVVVQKLLTKRLCLLIDSILI